MGVRLFLQLRLAGLLAAVLALSAAGCGRSSLVDLDNGEDAGPGLLPDGAPLCNATTCATGCCSQGECVTGTTAAFCGTGGAVCASCLGATAEVCDPTTRACVAPVPEAGVCNEGTCPEGCCDDSGKCQHGDVTSLCGSFGKACIDCQQVGMTCDPNLQQCVTTACAPGCTGCCTNGTCVPGTADSACGTGGTVCSDCASSGQSCAIDPFGGGLCEAPGCNATTCAGCCSAGGCLTGTSPSACGNEGDACVTCAASGEDCVALPGTAGGGLCTTSACSAVSCFGCCDAKGLCETGTAGSACGTDGATCAVCTSGNACVSGICEQAPSCGPSSCVGCCDDTGTCVSGADSAACGAGGEACMPCGAGAACISNVCQTSGPCNESNCAGCCNGDQCLDGTSDAACGTQGVACLGCGSGTNCTSGICTSAPCGPDNCGGCCDATGTCQTGDTEAVCGSFGVECGACTGDTQCVDGFCDPTCGPGTCSGCCLDGVCATGTQNAACGSAGEACGTCTGGTVCAGQACVTPAPCGPLSCTGCCDLAGTCEAGFLDTACGSGGASCASCTPTGGTCDVNATPRACTGQTGTCPASYPSCPSGVTLATTSMQSVCGTTDLSEVGSACVSGPSSAGCASFFTTEQSINASCATCLAQFDVPFTAETGVLLCAAPYLSGTCASAGACFENCESVSCSQCGTTGAIATCQSDVEAAACNTWYSQLGCVTSGLGTDGQFCNPSGYSNFGAWLQAVGGHYCAQ